MDVLNDRLIDAGLNALGYLIAGGLGVLIHSIILDRRRATRVVAEAPAEAVEPARPTASKAPQFVSLKTTSMTSQPVAAPSPETVPSRKDKAEIVRLARKMVQAGTDRKIIKRTLPISDAELNLLEAAGSVR
jgi:hypothetical protein